MLFSSLDLWQDMTRLSLSPRVRHFEMPWLWISLALWPQHSSGLGDIGNRSRAVQARHHNVVQPEKEWSPAAHSSSYSSSRSLTCSLFILLLPTGWLTCRQCCQCADSPAWCHPQWLGQWCLQCSWPEKLHEEWPCGHSRTGNANKFVASIFWGTALFVLVTLLFLLPLPQSTYCNTLGSPWRELEWHNRL